MTRRSSPPVRPSVRFRVAPHHSEQAGTAARVLTYARWRHLGHTRGSRLDCPVHRGRDVLESVLDHHPRCDSDDQHRRHAHLRRGHRHRSATEAGDLPADDHQGPDRQDHRGEGLPDLLPPAARIHLRPRHRLNRKLAYVAQALPALHRGWNCLVFDGPGQGRAVFEQGLVIRPDWENVVPAVVDVAVQRPMSIPTGSP